ncbi:MAG: hypothetical protein V4686_01240 [Patescibacteria group bacterium]
MKIILTVFAALLIGLITGLTLKPEPQKLTNRTITIAKWYCEDTISKMPPGREKAAMIAAFDNINEGSISYDPNFLSSKDAVSYKLVIAFANMYEARESFKFFPKTTPSQSRTSI